MLEHPLIIIGILGLIIAFGGGAYLSRAVLRRRKAASE